MRFLVIDDDPDIAALITRVVKALGHECGCAFCAADALKALEQAPFDRVVSDLKMPGVTGDKLYELLLTRKDPIARRMAFVTGNAMEPQNREFLDRTKVLVLEKPFTIDDLKAFLRKVESLGQEDGSPSGAE